jgi:hypothetical protein
MDEHEKALAVAALQKAADLLRERARFRQAVADIEGRPLAAAEAPPHAILVVDEISTLWPDLDSPARGLLEYIAAHGRSENVILHAND